MRYYRFICLHPDAVVREARGHSPSICLAPTAPKWNLCRVWSDIWDENLVIILCWLYVENCIFKHMTKFFPVPLEAHVLTTPSPPKKKMEVLEPPLPTSYDCCKDPRRNFSGGWVPSSLCDSLQWVVGLQQRRRKLFLRNNEPVSYRRPIRLCPQTDKS